MSKSFHSFHSPCPYGNDDCPKCKPAPQPIQPEASGDGLDKILNAAAEARDFSSRRKWDEAKASLQAHIEAECKRARLLLVDQIRGIEDYEPFDRHVSKGWMKDGLLDALDEEAERLSPTAESGEK